MTTTSPTTAHRAGLDLVLRALTAAGLAVTAYIHLHLAADYAFVGKQITLADLFRAQAVAAIIAALLLLIRGKRLAWVPAILVAAGSLAALVGTVYVHVPAIGPFPAIFEPLWFPEKVVGVLSVAIAMVTAIAGALVGRSGSATVRRL